LRAALLSAGVAESISALELALIALRAEAFEQQIPPERVVAYVKRIWHGTARPQTLNSDEWGSVYRVALTRSLMLYFGDE
jgi:hypothetical protein